ncbi:MAG: hypothetical protein LBI81_02740 [Puniceicoccales bacterium]|jgi:hypothetical protein|nr:hypothetical protein [Puniceicoccales bacterium]
MEYTDAVEIVSELFGIDSWDVGEYGERAAILDNHIEIRVLQAAQNVMIVQGMFGDPISNMSIANANETALRYLLQANFIQIIHSDDVLSIDKRTERLATTRRVPLFSTSLELIIDSIESFVHSIDFWDMALQRKQPAAIASPLLGFFRKK